MSLRSIGKIRDRHRVAGAIRSSDDRHPARPRETILAAPANLAFGLSGVIWLAILRPLQIRQARLARDFAGGGEIPAEYWRLSRRWNIAGAIASLLPLASLFFMVLKH